MANGDKLRVMVDSNVLIAALGWQRFPYHVIQHAVSNDYRLVLAPYIIEETTEKLVVLRNSSRPRLAELFADKLPALEALLAASGYERADNPTTEEITHNWSIVRDAKDIPIVLAAINAKVDYLISQDKDMTDPAQPVHQHLKIILPGTFLREHMGWRSDDLERVRTAE